MDSLLYQRPREKLRSKGAATLATAELLQVILGAGGPGATGAAIARRIETLLQKGAPTYEMLIAIQGIGEAKACQILAVLELAHRGNGHE